MASTLSAVLCPTLVLQSSVSTSGGGMCATRSGRTRAVSCCQSSRTDGGKERMQDGEGRRWAVASRREVVTTTAASITGLISGILALPALALLETDDDDSLLEKVKEDRKKRIEKRGAIISFKDETESVQKAVYELSKAGQAIDSDDFGAATSVLVNDEDGWIQEVKAAISKVNKNKEEESEAANFSSALQSLQAAVSKNDSKLSRTAFVASATALEKWSLLTGISDQIKGL